MNPLFKSICKAIYSFYKGSSKKKDETTTFDKTVYTSEIILADKPYEYSDCVPYMPLQDGTVVYVCKVYDGDTVTISWFDKSISAGVRIGCRINGIDTPEIRGSSDYEKKLAYLAKDRLYKKVMGKFVTIRKPELEKYGRVLADLEVGDCQSIKDYMLGDPEICKPYNGGTKQSWDV